MNVKLFLDVTPQKEITWGRIWRRRCVVYDKLLTPRQSFWITLYYKQVIFSPSTCKSVFDVEGNHVPRHDHVPTYSNYHCHARARLSSPPVLACLSTFTLITYHLDTVLNGILPPTTRYYQTNIFQEMSSLKFGIAYLASAQPSYIYPQLISVPWSTLF